MWCVQYKTFGSIKAFEFQISGIGSGIWKIRHEM